MNKFIQLTVLFVFVTMFAKAQTPKLEFRLISDRPTVITDETFKVKVPVKKFVNCIGFQYSIDWKSTDYEFVKADFVNLPFDGSSSDYFNEIKKGTLLLLWAHPQGKGINLADDAVSFELTFKAKKDGSVKDICFSQDALGIEIWRDGATIEPISSDFIGLNCGFFWNKSAKGEKTIAPLSTTTNTKDFAASDVKVFPNPTHDFLNIAAEKSIKSISVIDQTGRVVLSQDVENQNDTNMKIDVSNISNGFYLYQITTFDQAKLLGKFVKN